MASRTLNGRPAQKRAAANGARLETGGIAPAITDKVIE